MLTKFIEALNLRRTMKKVLLKILENLQESTCAVVFLIKVPDQQPATLLERETQAQKQSL